MGNFGQSTTRMRAFREKVLSQPNHIDTERALLLTEAYQKYADKSMIMKRALSLAYLLDHMTLLFERDDLLAGFQSSILRAAPLFPEYSVDWLLEEVDEFEKRDGDRFLPTPEQKDDIRRIHPYWHGITLQDRAYSLMSERSLDIESSGIIRALNMITCGDGHIAPDTPKYLANGFKGLKQEILEQKERLDLTQYDDLKKNLFYDAGIVVLDAAIRFAHRHADEAERLAETTDDAAWAEELRKIAQVCRNVPENAPGSFREAVQFVWFVQLMLQIDSNGHSFSMGRLDQYLYPYYLKDMESGAMDREQCGELLEDLCIKLYTINKIRPWAYTKFSAGCPMYENITIAGQTPDGKDAVNDLSYLFLDAIARAHLTQPNLTVRYHRRLSSDFMNKCIEVIKEGFGMPAFNSDEIIIPALEKRGVAHEDATNYSAIGCVEVAVPGKWGYRCTGMSFTNFAKIINMVLRGGVDDINGRRYFTCKPLVEMQSYQELFDTWAETCRIFAREAVIIDLAVDMSMEEVVPDVLCSVLTDCCIERGKTIKEGGAKYDFVSGLQVGIANLGNILAAIKKTVFDDKTLTAQQVMDALDANFEGPEASRVQQLLLDAPKYGCDDDYVDQLLVDAYTVYMNEIEQYHNSRYGRGPIGGTYYAGTSSISANVPNGAVVSATADGRKAGAPLAEGCSPSHGTDKCGPTGVFKTLSKLPNGRITGGVLLNQKVMRSSLKTEEDNRKLEMLIRTFFDDLTGFHVQYNFQDRATLEDAKIHPQNHRDLIVRVAGYSAFFTDLNSATQDDIIARTEHVI